MGFTVDSRIKSPKHVYFFIYFYFLFGERERESLGHSCKLLYINPKRVYGVWLEQAYTQIYVYI